MSKTILVVEDSLDISRLLEHILGQAGYKVVVVDEGYSGWAAYENLQPSLVLLDVNLPGLSGLEICRRIKETSDTPVIMLTVRAESEAVQQGFNAGADAYLIKPFEITQLTAAVEHVLRPQIRRITQK
jgi:two-component system response regulator MtrA